MIHKSDTPKAHGIYPIDGGAQFSVYYNNYFVSNEDTYDEAREVFDACIKTMLNHSE